MYKWLDNFLECLGYVRVKIALPPKFKPLTFTDRDATRAIILKTLREVNGDRMIEFLGDVSDKILHNLEGTRSASLYDYLRDNHEAMIAERRIAYAITCGIACTWEMDVKNFAEQMRIPVFEDKARKKQKSPGYRVLESVCDDLKKKLPKLNMHLGRTSVLRDALIHGNFHQLKTAASESQKASVRETFQGKAWKLDIGPQTITNLSEVDELNEVKKHGTFSWFLESASSELFGAVREELRERLEDLSAMRTIYSLSFGENAGMFKKICIDGERLSSSDVDRVVEIHGKHVGRRNDELKVALERIQKIVI